MVGNSLWEKGSWKHVLGVIISGWLSVLTNHDVRATQSGKCGLGHTAAPCICFPICRIPLPIGSACASWLMLPRDNEPGITVTQEHHKHSVFRRKGCFFLTASPTNSLTKDMFVGQELANTTAWPQPWLQRTQAQLISLQFTAVGKVIKPLFAEGVAHSYAPISQGGTDFPARVISSWINYY